MTTTTEGNTMRYTTKLQIRLWMMTLQVLAYLFVTSVLVMHSNWTPRDTLAVALMGLLALASIIAIVTGWLGYVSFTTGIKEVQRGAIVNDRP